MRKPTALLGMLISVAFLFIIMLIASRVELNGGTGVAYTPHPVLTATLTIVIYVGGVLLRNRLKRQRKKPTRLRLPRLQSEEEEEHEQL